jgi:NitT/TauT family transport system substrate-binding protein
MRNSFLPRTALVIACGLAAAALSACGQAPADSGESGALTKVRFVLPWVVQGEAAGYLLAKDKGFYEAAGLDVEIIPGGPDVRATALVTSGSAEFAAAPSASLIGARDSGMPVVALYSQNQSDGVVLVCKASSGVKSFSDLAGRQVGVWFGANDAKVQYALESAGVDPASVELLPQKFSMVEFFEDKFDCASASVWNELHIVYDAGYAPEDIVILDNADELGFYYTGDVGFTTEAFVEENPKVVQAFVDATLEGFRYMLDNPQEAADAAVAWAPDLDARKQLLQVEEANRLRLAGEGAGKGLGYPNVVDLETVQDIMLSVGNLDSQIDIEAMIGSSFWSNTPPEITNISTVDSILNRIEQATGH